MPFPSPRDLPHPGVESATLVSPALAGGFCTIASPGRIIQILIIGAFRLEKKATGEINIGCKQKDHYRMFLKWLRVAEKPQR